MAIKKTEYRPPVKVGETITYPDEVHFKTSSDIVIMGDGKNLEESFTTLNTNKVDKVTGKALSTNDYTTLEKNKLGLIQAEANKTIISNVLTESVAGKALDATQGKALKDEVTQHKLDYAEQAEFPINNLVANGDFSNGITGWIRSSTINVVLDNGKLRLDTSQPVSAYQVVNMPVGVYYLRAYTETQQGGTILFRTAQEATTTSNALPQSTNVAIKSTSGILNVNALSNRLNISRNATGGTTENYAWVGYISLINLTEIFGAGNEPTKVEMDALLNKFPNSWFEGSANLKTFQESYMELVALKKDYTTQLGFNNYKTVPTFIDGILTKIEEFSNDIVLKRIIFNYNVDGTINTITEMNTERTVISTMNYLNGEFVNIINSTTEGGL